MRIAHLTDIHLRHHLWGVPSTPRRRTRHMHHLLELALDQIIKQDADVLAITGDLLDAPRWLSEAQAGFEYDEVGPWRKAALKDYQLIHDMLIRKLKPVGLPWIVLPGNRDNDALFWQVFDESADVMEIAGVRLVRFCDRPYLVSKVGRGPRRFANQRLLFDEHLLLNDGLPQVHLQHYIIEPRVSEAHNYAEAPYLASQITQTTHVRLCLSGHYHKGTPSITQNKTLFATTSAFCDSPHVWRLFDIDTHNPKLPIKVKQHKLGKDVLPNRPVVFLDRDGVINEDDKLFHEPRDIKLIPGSAKAIARLNQAGYAVVVITNQAAVGRGFVPEDVLLATHDRLCRLLAQTADATIDAIYYATDAGPYAAIPKYSTLERAKPRDTMLRKAMSDLRITTKNAWMIGDRLTDANAATTAGVKPVLVLTGAGIQTESAFRTQYPEALVKNDLAAAVEYLLAGTQV